jgi:mechanosensitive ion channel-like protein
MLAIEWEQGLNDAWARIATFVPKLLGFFAILIIGYFLAKALARAADAILERVGFDGWVERGSLKTAMERSKFDPSDIVAVIVFWAIFLIALQLAFGIFGDNPVSDLITGIIAYLPNVLVAVIILVIAAAVAKVVTDILTATLGAVHGGQWMARGAGVAILVIGVFAALNQLQIAPEIVNGLYYAILVAIVGSAIVAVGGGGIRTMQRYWERTTETLERTGSEIKRNADPEVGRMAAQQRMEEERARMQAAREPGQQPEEVDLREETVPTAPRPDRP